MHESKLYLMQPLQKKKKKKIMKMTINVITTTIFKTGFALETKEMISPPGWIF